MAMRNDVDPIETREWLDALDSVLAFEGTDRAQFLLGELATEGRRRGAPVPYSATTPYVNTIPVDQQPAYPGDLAIEHRIRSLIRWNALAIVLRANKESSELGGHIASFQSVGDALRHRLHALLARARPSSTAATSSTSRATSRPASTPAPSWRGG